VDHGLTERKGVTLHAQAKALLLAGRVDEALPGLERAAANCAAFHNPIETQRYRLLLGRAREARGDTRGACEAYRGVVDRWGAAKPRSMSAEQARARFDALDCR
jgi:serine/threonine-protein kinase